MFGIYALAGLAAKHREGIKDFFTGNDDPTSVQNITRQTVKNIPEEFAEQVGRPFFRGTAAAASGIHSIGRRIQGAIDPTKTYEEYEKEFSLDLKPQGSFQESLYGTDKEISAGSFGREIRGGEPDGEIKPIDPTLGFVVGFADAIPGGSATKKAVQGSTELATQVYRRYGPTLGKQIEKLGTEVMQNSLIKGGEEIVANALNKPTVDVSIQKLVDSFSDIQDAIQRQSAARSLEAGERAAKAEQAMRGAEGAEALRASRRAMAGEMPTEEFPNASLAQLEQEEVDGLFNYIKNTDQLRIYEKANAMEGLAKILGSSNDGNVLPQDSQLKLLKKVFGDSFIRNYNNTVKTGWDRTKETLAQVANVPRALMSSLDLSAPLRQGLLLTVDKPKNAYRAFKSSLRYFADEKYFNAAMDAIENSPTAGLRQASGLELTDVSGSNFSLKTKEEAYMTDLLTNGGLTGDVIRSGVGATAGALTGDTPEERMKNALIGAGFGFISRAGVGASERAYTGYLNKLRADVFDDVASEMMRNGINPQKNLNEFEGVARFINVATGRGELKGNLLKGSAPALNAVFFSPRFLASRLQMFNPRFYMSLSSEGRKIAARSVAKLFAGGLTLLSLAQMNKNIEVGTDPTSSDFGKIKAGEYRYDIWGGFQQVAVLMSRLILGETTSAVSGKTQSLTDDNYFGQTRLSVLARFFRSKLAPVPSGGVDFLQGTNVIGEDVNISQQLKAKLLPFLAQDLIEAANEEGLVNPTIKLAPGIFGVGVQRFDTESSGVRSDGGRSEGGRSEGGRS